MQDGEGGGGAETRRGSSLPEVHWRRMQASMSASGADRSRPTLTSAPARPDIEYGRGSLHQQVPEQAHILRSCLPSLPHHRVDRTHLQTAARPAVDYPYVYFCQKQRLAMQDEN